MDTSREYVEKPASVQRIFFWIEDMTKRGCTITENIFGCPEPGLEPYVDQWGNTVWAKPEGGSAGE